jgi:hypothetical protein
VIGEDGGIFEDNLLCVGVELVDGIVEVRLAKYQ